MKIGMPGIEAYTKPPGTIEFMGWKWDRVWAYHTVYTNARMSRTSVLVIFAVNCRITETGVGLMGRLEMNAKEKKRFEVRRGQQVLSVLKVV